jgi:hypothetical protein
LDCFLDFLPLMDTFVCFLEPPDLALAGLVDDDSGA